MKTDPEAAHRPKELLAELKSLVMEAETLIAGSVTEHSSDAIEALRARFTAAQERFAEVCASAKKDVVAGAKCTDAAIRANPYQSLAIAAGIGLLLGVLLGRRSR
jgi:ElaB/YqjD/DUF883 family membrane-anchored ribosome-binding protein